MFYRNNTGSLGYCLHQCVLRNTLGGSKPMISTSWNPTVTTSRDVLTRIHKCYLTLVQMNGHNCLISLPLSTNIVPQHTKTHSLTLSQSFSLALTFCLTHTHQSPSLILFLRHCPSFCPYWPLCSVTWCTWRPARNPPLSQPDPPPPIALCTGFQKNIALERRKRTRGRRRTG